MKFLFAWELGGNLGHILRQRQLARGLRGRGHTVSFFLNDLEIGGAALADEGFACERAPVLNVNVRLAYREISSYGDILAAKGFAKRDLIEPVIRAWQTIYASERPDVAVLDHSPAALVAARLAGIPSSDIGTGFEIPPDTTPFPCFRPHAWAPPSMLQQTEKLVLATLNAIAADQGARQFDRLADCVRADQQTLLTFAEFDHYPERRNGHYLGPLFDVEHGMEVAWPTSGHTKNIFVYVRPDHTLPVLLDKLKALDANVICFIPGAPTELQARYASARFHIYTSALRLDRLLPACDLVVFHANHGVLSACVCFGVPVLGMPTQREQYLLGQRMQEAGIGLLLPRREAGAMLAASLDALLNDPKYKAQARALARKYASHDRQKVVTSIADELERMAR